MINSYRWAKAQKKRIIIPNIVMLLWNITEEDASRELCLYKCNLNWEMYSLFGGRGKEDILLCFPGTPL